MGPCTATLLQIGHDRFTPVQAQLQKTNKVLRPASISMSRALGFPCRSAGWLWVVVSQSSWNFSYIVPTCGTSTVRKRDISCAFCQSTCDAWGESKTQRNNGFPSNVVWHLTGQESIVVSACQSPWENIFINDWYFQPTPEYLCKPVIPT